MMIPSEYDIGDLMGMTDEEWDRGYEVSSGLAVSMLAEGGRNGNRVWVAAGRGSTNMRRRRGQDTCWWASVCVQDDYGGWETCEVRMTDDVDEPDQIHDLLKDMGVSDYQIHRAIKLWLWG